MSTWTNGSLSDCLDISSLDYCLKFISMEHMASADVTRKVTFTYRCGLASSLKPLSLRLAFSSSVVTLPLISATFCLLVSKHFGCLLYLFHAVLTTSLFNSSLVQAYGEYSVRFMRNKCQQTHELMTLTDMIPTWKVFSMYRSTTSVSLSEF